MSLQELLDQVREAAENELPFVVYSKPDQHLVEAVIQQDNHLDFTVDFTESGFIMAPFDTAEKVLIFHEDKVIRLQSESDPDPIKTWVEEASRTSTQQEGLKEKHIELVSKAIRFIEQGAFQKTVVSRPEFIGLDHPDIINVYKRLLDKYPGAFTYLWYHPKVGIWAGATPETLMKTEGTHFKTMALAGTQPYMGKMDVTWGQKEIREQAIVTDHITRALSEFEMTIGPAYTRRAGHLLHLCSDITGSFGQSAGVGSLIKRVHPTPAVCGMPTESAFEFILNEEKYDRSFYTGYLGELNRDTARKATGKEVDDNTLETSVFVNLRCMQLISGPNPGAVVYVGGGITANSDPVSEWEETVVKSEVMKSVLPK
jgi:isochorismate synthase